MSLETDVQVLTQATTDLLSAVNVKKATLDQSVDDAAAQVALATTQATNAAASAATATTKAGEAAGSAASALAIYGNTAAQQAAVTAAQNAASVAAGHAASASSVVQQDLSGVNAAALHRSPNAVTAMFVYDTSKDSDGGAWTEKCQHTSWYNEAINGKWLGAQASEAAARAVSGATTGDYFQLTTDGKFYKLNATSGTTEVFRGNKRDFPRLAGIVAEASNVTIYDLTEPGRPMWMRFLPSSGNASYSTSRALLGPSNVSTVYALNGILAAATASNIGYQGSLINFPADRVPYLVNGSAGSFAGNIARRNETLGFSYVGGYGTIPGVSVNSIAMTVLPDAPVDPVTGLQVPTIAVATAGRVSVIKHDGTVVSSVDNVAHNSVVITPKFLAVGRTGTSTVYYAYNPGKLNTSFAMATIVNTAAPDFNIGNINSLIGTTSSELLRRSETPATVQKLKNFESDPAKSAAATITNTYNTGHQVGDIRRTYLSDIAAGSAGTGTELVTNGDFSTSDLTGWSSTDAGASISVVDGRLQYQPLNCNTTLRLTVSLVVGKTYVATATFQKGTNANTHGYSLFGVSGSFSQTDPVVATAVFTATATSGTIELSPYACSNGTSFVDNVSVKEVVADRSYKAKSANITGTLTKTAVASAAQLVAYSGFSASNYLREPYSADLDFGTGEWSAGAWVSIPTANAAAGVIASRAHSSGAYITLGIDATNKLTATAFDGTTTRTVTTTAAYNTASWLKVRANYTTDGSLALLVNGQEVAVTRGAPLLTLNNSNAVLTIGNSYAADAPFPGSIALLKLSATVPTPEQSVWMYEQEKQLFRDGAQCCLPDSGAIVDLTYDDATDKWIAVSATNESEWSGLVRTSVTAVPAGSYTKASAASGVQLLARSTTSPGVDITIPAYGLREELVKRAESAARLARNLVPFDYVGGFTASTTNGSTSITSVAGLSYPVSYIGARVTGSGIPADTVITAVSGTTIYLSKAATATATGVQISFTDFILPVGYEAKAVLSAGSVKTEGSTKDYTRLFDGFRETIRFGTAPGYQAAVQIQATRSAA